MNLLKSQRGHAHIFLILVAVIALIGVVGFGVKSRSTADLRYAAATIPAGITTCEQFDNMTDEQSDAMTDEEWEAMLTRLCGNQTEDVDDADDVEPTTDANLAVDPCDAMSDEEYNKLTDAQLVSICGEDPDDSEEDDGGNSPVDAAKVPLTNKNGSATVTVTLASKQACLNTVSKPALKKTKAYGTERIKNRTKSLKAESTKLKTSYNKKASTNLKARKVAANAQLKAAAKHYKKRTPASIKVTTPTNHRKQITTLIKTTGKPITSAGKNLKKAKTSQQAAEITCNAILDTQVYAYVLPKIHAQKSIDSLYAQNAAYDVSYQLATKLAKMRGKSASTAKLTDPATIKNRINSLQAQLDAVNPGVVGQDTRASTRIEATITPVRRDIKASIKTSSIQAKKQVKTLN